MDTLTVKQLKEILNRVPEDMKVYGSWEGQIEEIRDVYPYKVNEQFVRTYGKDSILLIDVDGWIDPKEAWMNQGIVIKDKSEV